MDDDTVLVLYSTSETVQKELQSERNGCNKNWL